MNKLRTAKFLIAATILVVLAFQVYWINKLYEQEQANFSKSTDIIFRDAMYRLQAQRFTSDTMVFKGMPGDNIFMSDIISSVKEARIDSPKRRMMISMSTDQTFSEPAKQIKKDTVIYVDTKNNGGLPPGNIERFLEHNQILNDSIPVARVDSMYKALLLKEGITVGFTVQASLPPLRTDSLVKKTVRIMLDHPADKFFVTRQVPVGFTQPLFYSAAFNSPFSYIMKKISVQLLLSLLLIALTIVSFIFIYRSLLAQKRLTAIKNEFIGNITHELKTPISTVSVAIEAMKNFNALQNPERTQEYLGIAGQELNRLSLLVDKVLRLSMFETQQVELKYEWFDMRELLNEVMRSMQLQFEKTGATVNLQTTGEDFSIMADRMHITSVIYNLLDNALKYSKGKPAIDVSLNAGANEMELRVKDNGIGIPAAYREKVFDKFFRVPHGDKHNVKGYGLGLSYVAHIIAGHKGTVKIESSEGQGTTFIIQLPKEDGGS